ncbi:MAG: phosphatase PAP2 family protein [Bacteroidota bacterium]
MPRIPCLLAALLMGTLMPSRAQVADSLKEEPAPGNIRMARYVPTISLGLATAVAWRDQGFFSRGEVYRWRREQHSGFRTHADNTLQFVPIGVAFLTEALHGGAPDRYAQSALHLLKAQALMAVVVYPVKQLSHVERPNKRNFQSFPSGHTAQAFLSATFLHRELRSPQYADLSGRNWLIAGGYVAAATTGTLRIMNNAHWLTDVLAGAAIGMLAGNLAYDLRLGKRKQSTMVSVMPCWNGGGGLALMAGWR